MTLIHHCSKNNTHFEKGSQHIRREFSLFSQSKKRSITACTLLLMSACGTTEGKRPIPLIHEFHDAYHIE